MLVSHLVYINSHVLHTEQNKKSSGQVLAIYIQWTLFQSDYMSYEHYMYEVAIFLAALSIKLIYWL